jgi:hypothetical protein
MTRADDATLIAAMEALDLDRPWSKARRDVIPMLPRVRPYPMPVDPLRMMLPPGILVGFAIDSGPILATIVPQLLDQWGISPPELAASALENVRARANACDPGLVVRHSIDEIPVQALQTGVGIGASMLLAPDTLNRFFGPGPALLLAPMRDLILALPATVDHDVAAWLAQEWESMDPNHLHLGGWRYERGTVSSVALEQPFATA